MSAEWTRHISPEYFLILVRWYGLLPDHKRATIEIHFPIPPTLIPLTNLMCEPKARDAKFPAK